MEKKKAIESELKEGQVIEQFTKKNNESSGEIGPKIKRGRYDSLELYEVSESELTIIERGSPSSTYLNFAIFLLSIASSFLTTLLTVDLSSKMTLFTIFTVICVIGYLIGVFLVIIWFQNKNEFKKIIEKIRERMKE
jgi:amino acid transporter